MDIEEIYRTYFSAVYRYIRSISRDEALAEDVTQETFFKAMKKLDQFRGDCDIRIWLCQIAKRTLYDRLKKEGRQLPVPDAGGEEPVHTDLEACMADHSLALRIHEILHRMKEPYKEVFSLRTFGELSYADIGGIFGKSENWAKVTYYRARVKIREEMEHENHM